MLPSNMDPLPKITRFPNGIIRISGCNTQKKAMATSSYLIGTGNRSELDNDCIKTIHSFILFI
jgi:hypothetical protein